jgi:hypothetical protein
MSISVHSLQLSRQFVNHTTTVGILTHQGERVCRTLEDKARPNSEFVAGQTAIPAGTYQVVVTFSPHLKRFTGLLLGVPHQQDGMVRLHRGEKPSDSEACVLLGLSALDWQLDGCAEAEMKVTELLRTMLTNGAVHIEITNDFGPLPE